MPGEDHLRKFLAAGDVDEGPLGEVILARGYATWGQIEECVRLQREMAEKG
jgi:pentatricopeptide repeat protein